MGLVLAARGMNDPKRPPAGGSRGAPTPSTSQRSRGIVESESALPQLLLMSLTAVIVVPVPLMEATVAPTEAEAATLSTRLMHNVCETPDVDDDATGCGEEDKEGGVMSVARCAAAAATVG